MTRNKWFLVGGALVVGLAFIVGSLVWPWWSDGFGDKETRTLGVIVVSAGSVLLLAPYVAVIFVLDFVLDMRDRRARR